jgi:hypothetical protein
MQLKMSAGQKTVVEELCKSPEFNRIAGFQNCESAGALFPPCVHSFHMASGGGLISAQSLSLRTPSPYGPSIEIPRLSQQPLLPGHLVWRGLELPAEGSLCAAP